MSLTERDEPVTMHLRVVVPAGVSQVDVIDAMDDVPAEIYVLPDDEPRGAEGALGTLVETADAARAKSWNDPITLRAFLDALETARSHTGEPS